MSSQRPFKDFLDFVPRDVSTVRGCSHSVVCSMHLVKRVVLHLQEDLREFVHTLVPLGSKVLCFELVEITAIQQDITCPLRHSDNRERGGGGVARAKQSYFAAGGLGGGGVSPQVPKNFLGHKTDNFISFSS